MSEPPVINPAISHYRIVSRIGAGGMGEVYLAMDTKLDRKVALKILPAGVAANQDRMRRFVQEAKTASALNHPNILTIHEISLPDRHRRRAGDGFVYVAGAGQRITGGRAHRYLVVGRGAL